MDLKKIAIASALVALAAIAGLVYRLRNLPPNPVALITVLDAAGHPVTGATVRPYALRPKNGGGDYFWTEQISVKPLPVTTDLHGIARVGFPKYIVERLETGEISVAVDHPDFASDSFPRDVAFAPPANASLWKKVTYPFLVLARRASARPKPITLTRGSVLRVCGYLDSEDKLLTNIHPQATSIGLPETNYWAWSGDGWMATRRLRAGSNAVRLVYFPEKGQAYFSETKIFLAAAGQTAEFKLQLKPGFRLAGKLDASVPRPIVHGRVQLEVFPAAMPPAGTETLHWETSRTINADGTFVFESVPGGEVEVIAICDGFVSANGPAQGSGGGMRTPQVFTLEGDREVGLEMEPAGACEVAVLDDQGKPLAGALVSFWPNVIWGGRSSTIFARDSFNWEDVLASGLRPDWSQLLKSAGKRFQATTDERGIALVRDLPGFGGLESFNVEHTNFEMGIEKGSGDEGRRSEVSIKAGETNRTVVTLQKRGTQVMMPRK